MKVKESPLADANIEALVQYGCNVAEKQSRTVFWLLLVLIGSLILNVVLLSVILYG